MIPHIVQYGMNLLQEHPEIILRRTIGQLPNTINIENTNDIVEWIRVNEIMKEGNSNSINIKEIKVVEREVSNNFELGWHIDDCSLIKHSKKFQEDMENNSREYKNIVGFIGEKYAIYAKNELPKYSVVVYRSTINKDFEGGVFEFADGTRVEPREGMYVVFDSREVHRVQRVMRGNRRNIVVKFY
jgi:hypothetical protein